MPSIFVAKTDSGQLIDSLDNGIDELNFYTTNKFNSVQFQSYSNDTQTLFMQDNLVYYIDRLIRRFEVGCTEYECDWNKKID